jgi:2-polyprenyl-3-methyl-5-hydroxy-6-metoxy-1,4-benzoquinol methylase
VKPSIVNTDAVWEWFGKNQPYFGVLIEAKYRNEQLNEEAKKDFFSTGKAHVHFVLQTIKEHFDTNFMIKRALDFGCGVGRLTIPLSAACKKVVGVDASPSMLQEAKKNAKEMGAESIEFLLADENLSTLGSEGFDFINSFIVFQHIPLDRGYHLLRRLLSLLNEGGIGALHFTYSTPPPDGAFTLRSKHGFVWYLRYRSYVVNGIMNLVEGNSFDRPLLIMQMNEYNLSTIHKLLYENECGEVYTRFTNHDGALGVLLFFRKKSILPL